MSVKLGDVVILKSGGPAIAAADIYMADEIECAHCQWFVGSELCSNVFASAQIMLVTWPVTEMVEMRWSPE